MAGQSLRFPTQEWQLENVVENERFTIRGFTEDDDMSLSFTWVFEPVESGTRLTQNIRAEGDDLDAYAETFFSHGGNRSGPT